VDFYKRSRSVGSTSAGESNPQASAVGWVRFFVWEVNEMSDIEKRSLL
jgi:hypothetical protein